MKLIKISLNFWLGYGNPFLCVSNRYGNNKALTSVISEKVQQIHKIIETEALTISEIEELPPHCSQYVIPYNQRKGKTYALILYNVTQRSGSEEKANYLENSLNESGWNVIKLEWQDTAEHHNMIDSSFSPIVSSCSLLMVCLMSNGNRGSVIGSDG